MFTRHSLLRRERLHLRTWANTTREGIFGTVRLADKPPDTHRYVAEPIGQCLLRRQDLDQIRRQFEAEGFDPYSSAATQLASMESRVHYAFDGRQPSFFTQHALTILDDGDRRDAAWKQIIGEIKAIVSQPASPKDESTPHKQATKPAISSSKLREHIPVSPMTSHRVLFTIHQGLLSAPFYK